MYINENFIRNEQADMAESLRANTGFMRRAIAAALEDLTSATDLHAKMETLRRLHADFNAFMPVMELYDHRLSTLELIQNPNA